MHIRSTFYRVSSACLRTSLQVDDTTVLGQRFTAIRHVHPRCRARVCVGRHDVVHQRREFHAGRQVNHSHRWYPAVQSFEPRAEGRLQHRDSRLARRCTRRTGLQRPQLRSLRDDGAVVSQATQRSANVHTKGGGTNTRAAKWYRPERSQLAVVATGGNAFEFRSETDHPVHEFCKRTANQFQEVPGLAVKQAIMTMWN